MITLFESMTIKQGDLLRFEPDGRCQLFDLYQRLERGVMKSYTPRDPIQTWDQMWTVLDVVIDRDKPLCIVQMCSAQGAKGWVVMVASGWHPERGSNLLRHNFEIIEDCDEFKCDKMPLTPQQIHRRMTEFRIGTLIKPNREVNIRMRMEELRRARRGLNEQRLNPASGCRLDELYPTLPAPGALLRFDLTNKSAGRWRYKPDEQQVGEGDIGYRNLAIGVKSFRTSTGEMSWSLESPFVLAHPDAAITLLPCEPVLIGDLKPYVKIMVNTVRRDSEILWSPVSDLVIV